YELLAGRRLFDAPEQHEILENVRSMPIPSPSQFNPEVPPEVDEIVRKALTRDPEKRWQRAGDMRDAIGQVAAGRLTPRQFVSWVEWVFAQKEPLRREDSGVSALHEILSQELQVVGDLPSLAQATEDRRRESVAMMPPLGAAMLQRHRSRTWLWISLLALAGAAALLAKALGAF
ncbi:MAG: hypothetical protein JNL83_38635, partial [Myxococcales bacterium]|nr:hypothetical protein [Myxococcales bacterium]